MYKILFLCLLCSYGTGATNNISSVSKATEQAAANNTGATGSTLLRSEEKGGNRTIESEAARSGLQEPSGGTADLPDNSTDKAAQRQGAGHNDSAVEDIIVDSVVDVLPNEEDEETRRYKDLGQRYVMSEFVQDAAEIYISYPDDKLLTALQAATAEIRNYDFSYEKIFENDEDQFFHDRFFERLGVNLTDIRKSLQDIFELLKIRKLDDPFVAILMFLDSTYTKRQQKAFEAMKRGLMDFGDSRVTFEMLHYQYRNFLDKVLFGHVAKFSSEILQSMAPLIKAKQVPK